MGGIADSLWLPDLLPSLLKNPIPYVVIVQANSEGLVESEAQRVALRDFYRKAHSVIFVSRHNLELARRQLAMDFDHAVIILNPLRAQVPTPIPWPQEGGPWRLAEVARLEIADKQQDHLLKALSGESWKERDWQLTLYGSGPDEEHLKRLIEFYGLGSKVKIGGYVRDFQEIWRDHHLHVLPSRREGMPLALIESMACGRPAVVTRAGGSPELIEDGVNGWVCPGMHPEVLAQTLEIAWAQRDQWQTMGEAARSKIQQVSEPDWADRILEIVKRAANQETHP